MNIVCQHYAGYIAHFSMRKLRDERRVLLNAMKDNLKQEPMADVEYVEVVGGADMQPVLTFEEGDLVAMAVRIGTTRLIDNFSVGEAAIEF